MATDLTSAVVKEYCTDAGAQVAGIASAESFGTAPKGFKPADVLSECRSVIVLGAAMPSGVLNDIDEYTASRNAMIASMTSMARKVAKRITKDGFKTKVISATGGKWAETADGKKEHRGNISLKHAAEIAGLGVIGKNYLLTSPQLGNLIWLSAVLTDAELEPDKKAEFVMCGGCNKCVEACPVGALKDPAAFGRKDCAKFFKIEDKRLRIKCFKCRTVCPYVSGTACD